jgi:hypothetical protein
MEAADPQRDLGHSREVIPRRPPGLVGEPVPSAAFAEAGLQFPDTAERRHYKKGPARRAFQSIFNKPVGFSCWLTAALVCPTSRLLLGPFVRAVPVASRWFVLIEQCW